MHTPPPLVKRNSKENPALKKDIFSKFNEDRLKALGFCLIDGYEALYIHNKFKIKIDLSFKNSKVYYPPELIIHDQTTSNFAKEESYIVLQCVIKLLELGYLPENIELEKSWKLGIKEKGKLDILLKHPNGKTYAMIECKSKKEFTNTWNKMLKDGKDRKQQLFSYYQQDKNTNILILYTYDFYNNASEYHVIQITEEMKKASNIDECINEWNKSSLKQGFFEKKAYQSDFDSDLRRSYLQEITEETGNSIYHAFATILRKHSVSDKSNAYNRLFNLFLCKIIDEDRQDNDIVDFQWKEDDNYIALAKRLNSLYKKGMLKFLDKEVTDYTDEDLKKYKDDKKLQKMFDELRLYKNNEFSFIDVFNEESFMQNMKIVKDIVQLLQYYQFRYTHKHQYLGNFFELLLNTGFKQENGQFFTPVPLSEFIVRSLPLKEMIQENDALPYIIDYACGSGHFLTESMDEIQYLIENEELSQTPSVKKDLASWKENPYKWANEYIYGIDNDYRLIKTTKIACFLNGDGEANIIHTNGLFNFQHKDFIKKLGKQNQFDILLANPPYSVDGFLHQLNNDDKEKFQFTKIAPPNTDDIECFFIERAKQILKDNGFMGIILPISILQNSDELYKEARKILLQNFEIKALFDVGSSGFMATGINVIIVFARKNEKLYNELREIVDKFFNDKKDVVCRGIKNAFSLYVSQTFDGMTFENYLDFIKTFNYNQIENEKDRMITFMMTSTQIIPVVRAGNKDFAQKFLGYKFSDARGNEGLHIIEEGKLFSKDKRLVEDKVNYYIYSSFLGNITINTAIHKDLRKNIFITRLSDLIAWENEKNWSAIRLFQKRKIFSKYPLVRLKDQIDYSSGSRPKGGISQYKVGAISLGGEQISQEGVIDLTKIPYVPIEFYENAKTQSYVKTNDILICKDGALTGKVALIRGNEFSQKEVMVNEHIFIIRSKEKDILQHFLFYCLHTERMFEYIQSLSQKSAQEGYNTTNLENTEIPKPSIDEQKRIITSMQEQDNIIFKAQEVIIKMEDKLQNINFSSYPMKSIKEVMILEYGVNLPEKKRIKGPYLVVGSNGVIGYHHQYLVEPPCVVVGRKGSAGEVNWYNQPITPIDTTFYIKPLKNNLLKYLYHILKLEKLSQYKTGAGSTGINREMIYGLKIPVPSLKEQEKIVQEIMSYENAIENNEKIIKQAKEKQKEIMTEVFSIE